MEPEASVPEIDVAELAERLDKGAALLDVREPDEYETAHVPGAELIPLQTVPDRLADIPKSDAGPLCVICAKGGRSMRAAEFLQEQGFDVVNVAGGTTAWIDAGHPTATGTDR